MSPTMARGAATRCSFTGSSPVTFRPKLAPASVLPWTRVMLAAAVLALGLVRLPRTGPFPWAMGAYFLYSVVVAVHRAPWEGLPGLLALIGDTIYFLALAAIAAESLPWLVTVFLLFVLSEALVFRDAVEVAIVSGTAAVFCAVAPQTAALQNLERTVVVGGALACVLAVHNRRQAAELKRLEEELEAAHGAARKATDLERARIAHQIHDTAAQSMVSAFRFLDAARAYAAAHPGESIEAYLENASDRMVTAIKEVRAVLADLVPPGLEELGLGQAIHSRMKSLAAESGMEMTIEGELPRLDDWVEQALYGMTTEALTNAVRHSQAHCVRAELRVSKGRAVVAIEADGQGFDPAAAERRRKGGGLGLLGIARQARWLGGAASVRSRIGNGTHVRISIPIARHTSTRAGYPGTGSDAGAGGRSGEGKP